MLAAFREAAESHAVIAAEALFVSMFSIVDGLTKGVVNVKKIIHKSSVPGNRALFALDWVTLGSIEAGLGARNVCETSTCSIQGGAFHVLL